MLSIARPRIPARTPLTYRYTITSDDMTSITVNQSFTLLSLPANYVVVGTRIQNLTAWAAVSLSGLTVEIGTASFVNAFGGPYSLIGSPSPTTISLGGAWTETTVVSQTVQALFTSTGASIDALTSGSCQLTLVTQIL